MATSARVSHSLSLSVSEVTGAAHERVTAALLLSPNVADCAVLSRSSAHGERLVAYVVAQGPFSRSRAEAALRDAKPELRLPDDYVLISSVPVDANGSVNEAALLSLPLVDSELAERLEAALRADERVEHAAVFVDESPRRAPALHLGDLFVAPTAAHPSAGASAPAAAAAPALARAESASTGLPLAVSLGKPLPARAPDVRTLADLLRSAAKRFSDPRITYLANDGSPRGQTFAELLTEARRIAAGLRASGLRPGQYVLIHLVEVEDVLSAFWGCLLGGFVPAITPVPPHYQAGSNDAERLRHVSELLDAPPFLTTAEIKAKMAPLQERLALPDAKFPLLEALRSSGEEHEELGIDPDSAAFLVFTSGSTGAPKIIQLSHNNILTRAFGTNLLCSHDEHDRILNWLPFDHIGSISDWHLRCVDIGCHMIYCSKEYVLGDPLNWLRLIARYRITHSWAPNFAYALVNDALNTSKESWDLSCMKALLTAGEAVSSKTVYDFLARLAVHGLPSTALRPAFGMAELGSGVTYFLPTPEAPVRVVHVDRAHLDGALRRVPASDPDALGFTSLGPVIPGAGMRIVDDALAAVPELTVGRLHISGGPVCLGYFRNPEANRDVFVGDGWFNTGDRGFLCDGELYLTGRDKESLIINGANYHNSEIEAAVETVPGVEVSFTAACAVRKAGDPEERLVIFFSPVASNDAQLTSILRKVQSSVARKTGVKPDYILPVERSVIPKTAIGKLQRKQLTKRFEAGDFDALAKRIDVMLETEQTVPDWFSSPFWRAKSVGPLFPGAGRRCRLVAAPDALGAELRRQLAAAGVAVADGESSNGAAPVTDVIDLSGYAPFASSGLESAPAPLLALSAEILKQAAVWAGSTQRHVYLVVAAHAQPAPPSEPLVPSRSLVPPLLKALTQEAAVATCRHVDFRFSIDATEVQAQAARIVEELLAVSADDEVAYRAGKRLVKRFERVSWAPLAERDPGLVRGGFYAITGGLGGVGLELARYLLGVWSAKLLLLGRSELETSEPLGASDAKKLGQLKELRALGDVQYRALDVADASALEAAVRDAERKFAQPLAGAFHLAGVYHEKPMAEENAELLASAFHAKGLGAVAVHALLRSRPAAFVVCFSSLASVFSGSNIGVYAAVNRFVDSLSQAERQAGRRSYSLNWSMWKNLGIGAEGAPADVLRSKGYYQVTVLAGMRSLAAVLTREPQQLMVGVDVGHPAMERWHDAPPRALSRLRGAFVLREGARDDSAERSPAQRSAPDRFGQAAPAELWRLISAPLTSEQALDRDAVLGEIRGGVRELVAPRTPVEKKLVEIWKEVLGLETLGVNESFFDLGGTSLLSVRLFAEIERKLGTSLPLATLFKAATVEALAGLLGDDATPTSAVESIVVLAAGDARFPLFLLHDAGGSVNAYRPLAAQLAPKFSVYGVEPYHKERFPSLHTRIPDMARYYAGQIRAVQPKGPYALGGAGEGAVLAFEVACALKAEAEEVALLALFDARQAPSVEAPGTFGVLAASISRGKGLNGLIERVRSGSPGELKQELTKHGMAGLNYARARMLRRYTDSGQELPWFLQHIPPESVYRLAESEHAASRFDGAVTLLRAAGEGGPPCEPCKSAEAGWGKLASAGAVVIDVACAHDAMLEAASAPAVVAKLAPALEQAFGSHRSEASKVAAVA